MEKRWVSPGLGREGCGGAGGEWVWPKKGHTGVLANSSVSCLWWWTHTCCKVAQNYIHTRYCCCLVAETCLTLCNPVDCSPPSSSVHGISQARILEWVAISSSRGSSPPSDRICISWNWILYHWATGQTQNAHRHWHTNEYKWNRKSKMCCMYPDSTL